MHRIRKQCNIPLITGAVILAFLLMVILFNDSLRTTDPYSTARQRVICNDEGKTTILRPPFSPNAQYYFGTDELGRDIYSQIIYGARFTLQVALISIFTRLLFALPFGYLAAFGSKWSKEIINQSSLIATAVPAIMINFIVLRFKFIQSLDLNPSIVAFGIVIGITEWGRLGKLIQAKIEEILNKAFVRDGDRIIGKSKLQIATKSVTPHLLPFLIVYLSLEISRSLIMLMQLGVFNIFLGNKRYDVETITMLINRSFSYEPEWSAIMADAPKIVNTRWWIVLFPAIAFFIAILGFNLFAEGLRTEFEKESSKLFYTIRRCIIFISPKEILRDIQLKNKKSNHRRIGLAIALIFLLLSTQYRSPYSFHGQEAFATLKYISENEEFSKAYASSDSIESKRNYIVDQLKKSNIAGYEDFNYLQNITVQNLVEIKDVELTIAGSQEKFYMKDGIFPFAPTTTGLSLPMTYLPPDIDFPRRYDPKLIRKLIPHSGKIMLVGLDESASTDEKDIYQHARKILTHTSPKAMIFIQKNSKDVVVPLPTTSPLGEIAIIIVNEQIGEALSKHINKTISINMSTEPVKNDLVNIIATIPGTHPELKKEIIYVGVPYGTYATHDGEGKNGAVSVDSALSLQLQMIKQLSNLEIKPKRTIAFIFWDGTFVPRNSGSANFKGVGNLLLEDTEFFISIGPSGFKESSKIAINTSSVSNMRPASQSMAESIKIIGKKLNLKTSTDFTNSAEVDDLYKNGFSTIFIHSQNSHQVIGTNKDTFEYVDKKKLEKMGQLLLDGIIKLTY